MKHLRDFLPIPGIPGRWLLLLIFIMLLLLFAGEENLQRRKGPVQHWHHRWPCRPDEALFVSGSFSTRYCHRAYCFIKLFTQFKLSGNLYPNRLKSFGVININEMEGLSGL